jgi:hypothetical protein
MSFSKYMAMVEGKALHLTRGDGFQDGHEGSISAQSAERRARNLEASSDLPSEYTAFSHFKMARQYVEISCWYSDIRENSLLWDTYGGGDAVAVSTTAGLLRKATLRSMQEDPHIHQLGLYAIRYIDFQTDEMDLNTSPFLYKRTEFSAEREVRLIRQSWTPRVAFPAGKEPIVAEHPPSFPTSGSDIRVRLGFIEQVVVSPKAAKWFVELIEKLTTRFQIRADVRQSILVADPRF